MKRGRVVPKRNGRARMLTGADIQRIRRALALTQATFADLIGVSRNTIMRWESGETAPSMLEVRGIVAATLDMRTLRGKETHA